MAEEPETTTNSEEPSEPTPSVAARLKPYARYAVPAGVVLAAAAILLLFTLNWDRWQAGRRYQSTDAASVQADITPLTAKLPGRVLRVHVEDFQVVKAGDLLVELDPDDMQSQLDAATAAVEGARAALANLVTQRAVHEETIAQARLGLETAGADLSTAEHALDVARADSESARSGLSAAEKDVESARAGLSAVRADNERASLELDRQQNLLRETATTRQRLEAASADAARARALVDARELDVLKAQELVKVRQQDVRKSTDQIAVREQDIRKTKNLIEVRRADLEKADKQREIFDGQQRQLESQLTANDAQRAVAQSHVDDMRIVAPVDGVAGEVKVKIGQNLAPGAQALVVVSTELWVVANFKEGQLANMRPGDEAEVELDAVPGVTMTGRVETLSPATGSEYSLIPPDNASGSFTKVTQRVPVKIVLVDTKGYQERLRPGLNADVTVKTGSAPEPGAKG